MFNFNVKYWGFFIWEWWLIVTGNLKIGKNRINDLRNKDGTFKKGTQIGRMKKKGFTLTDLNKLIRKYEKTKSDGETLLRHYIKQLFKDNRLLEKYIDKNIPIRNELTGAGGEPLSITLREIIYGKDDQEPEKDKSGEAKT